MAPDGKLRNLRGNSFTLACVNGKVQIVCGVGRKPFGVDSAGGFFIGAVGVVVHCGHPLRRRQFDTLGVEADYQLPDFSL